MSPSPAGFNPFSSAMGRMTNGSGGGFIAEQRRMQFMLGMTHLQHQLGMERDAVQHEYDKGMAKAQGKQARKTLKAQSAANMERDTHQSQLKINEKWAEVEQQDKREKNANNNKLSYLRREGKLPLTRQEVYQAKQQRRRDDIEIAGKELELKKSQDISAREQARLDAQAASQETAEKMFASMFPGMMPGQDRPQVPSLEVLARSNFGKLGAPSQTQAPQQPQTLSESENAPGRPRKTVAQLAAEKRARGGK